MPTPSRLAPARALHTVFGAGKKVPDYWDERLSMEDAHLAQAILGHALRSWGRLQAWVQPHLKNPERGIPLGSKVALALGLVQLAWLPGVSSHAAVNESVDLAADATLGFPPHRGLVNAILRKASTDREALTRQLDALPTSLDRPPFAQRVLEAALAPHGATGELEALWQRLQQPPRPAYRVLRGDPPEGLRPDPALPGCWDLEPGAPFPRAWLVSGAGMVQDRSSQALLAFPYESHPRNILDTCAAPGGKTTTLAQRWPEAEKVALESDPRRAQRLRENLQERGVTAGVLEVDALDWLAAGSKGFDLVLVDAPCSGSGTLQKHPELAWIGERIDIQALVARQRALLEAALPRVAPGGLLIYAVCSWLPEEGEAHFLALQNRPDFSPLPLWSGSPQFRPHPLTWDGEGFQAFALRRQK